MNLRLIKPVYIFTVLVLLGIPPGMFTASAAQDNMAEAENGVDVLANGPIHEAFAEPVELNPEPGIIIPKVPPDSINEIPPEQKPEGDVEWIPGYWNWDDERNDFIWVSGIWRVVPPGRQWIPGYWVKVEKGFQWVSGYWAADEKIETEYLPEPPETVEAGPNVSAPSPDYGWIPGCWIWLHGRYVWRPGYWEVMRSDRVWVPAYYTWTPRGYIFVEGYWDFAVDHRGVLFAPVFFDYGVTWVHGFYFTPSIIIDLGVFSDWLFLRPIYHHYYFGDYYALKYYRKGIYPWFSPHARRHVYNPIYAHQRWKHRHNRHWENRLYKTYKKRRKNLWARPPRIRHFSEKSGHRRMILKTPARTFNAPFRSGAKNKKGSSRFRSLSKKEHRWINRHRKSVDRYGRKRQNWISQKSAKPADRFSRGINTNKLRFPRSPVEAKPFGRVNRRNFPHKGYQSPKPNPNVKPLIRRSYGFQKRNHGQRTYNRAGYEHFNHNRWGSKRVDSNGNGRIFHQRRHRNH